MHGGKVGLPSVMLLGFMPEAATRWRFRVDSYDTYVFPPSGDSKVSYSWSTQPLSFIARERCSVEDLEDLTTPEFVFDSAHN
jgi:hypothetical protein